MDIEDLGRAVWLRRLIVTAILVGLVLLSVQVLQPFIVPVIWAVILAFVTWPAHERLVKLCAGRREVAALLMTLTLSAAIIVPIVWFVTLIQTEAMGVYREFSSLLGKGFTLPEFIAQVPLLGSALQDLLERVAHDPTGLDGEIKRLLDQFSGNVADVLGGVGRNIVKLIIAMVSLFFMYRDGEQFAAQVAKLLQQFFGTVRVGHYLVAVGDTVKAVVYGLVLAALAQAVLAGLGYWVAGINAPLFLAAVTFLIALIPFMVPLVWSSASLWLLLKGDSVAALGLFVWGLTAVSWIDNIVRPLVISGATRIPFLLVMFGVLGGLAAFGLVGLFIGPVILAVLIAVWREWLADQRPPEPPEEAA